MPTLSKVCPCFLFEDIVKVSFIGANNLRTKLKGYGSQMVCGMHGISIRCSAFLVSMTQLGVNHTGVETCDYVSRAIAMAIRWVEISQRHDGHTLQVRPVCFKIR